MVVSLIRVANNEPVVVVVVQPPLFLFALLRLSSWGRAIPMSGLNRVNRGSERSPAT